MCTVTIVPLAVSAPLIRLACNRDESRSRPAALCPVIRRFGARWAIMPVDPVLDGTWIAVNDAGLAATLLNVYPGPRQRINCRSEMLSRGRLVPRLMSCATVAEAEQLGREIDVRRYQPFRLVLVRDQDVVQFFSEGVILRHERTPLTKRPLLFTSSGLGDDVVEPARRALFEQLLGQPNDWERQQAAFHRHAWPERRHISVCMERAEARTVSHAVVDIASDRVVMTYTADAPDRGQPLLPITLTRTEPGTWA
jgi:hypothetical protein